MSPAERSPSARAVAAATSELPVIELPLVDRKRADALANLGVRTIGDLVRHYPFRYLDLSTVADMRTVPAGSEATVVGRVHDIKVKHPKPRLSITEIALVDGTGALIGVWFNQPYMASRFRVGERVAFAGQVSFEFGLKQMRSPFVERLDDETGGPEIARIIPVHHATEGLSTNWTRRLVTEALRVAGDVPDPLPAPVRLRHGFDPLRSALRNIHFPQTTGDSMRARRRLAYDELLAVQLAMALRRQRFMYEARGHVHETAGEALRVLASSLPFELSTEQQSAVADILEDMRAPHPMNRLLLGDVGTGKTVVAAHALAVCADSGTQAAMMAPTEVLAAQYARAVGPLLDATGIPWALLTGSTKPAERKRVLEGLATGAICVAFGTHALIQKDVIYHRLSLAVVDEQHRFGVQQRLTLRSKGEAPDLLVMTATPIPRSLALTLYGDLDTTYLRHRPGGRGKGHVATRVVPMNGRADAYQAVRDAAAGGKQAYVVCALVDESDAVQAKAATTEARRLQRQVFPELRVGLLTGQMPTAEKVAAMERFRDGAIDVLVATTVIEVGVDVPAATVMIVEDADRFGLSQLHQLRGRIGRGVDPGIFMVFADARTDDARARMEAIASTDDGFELAELDLRLRGEGEVLGDRQSGVPGLRLASLSGDADLLEAARADAREIVRSDPGLTQPQHVPLREDTVRRIGAAWEWVSSG
ncbi:MAG: ATP-dependent DNA helicase RecG [Coriobacteriia bacterium]